MSPKTEPSQAIPQEVVDAIERGERVTLRRKLGHAARELLDTEERIDQVLLISMHETLMGVLDRLEHYHCPHLLAAAKLQAEAQIELTRHCLNDHGELLDGFDTSEDA